MYKIKTIPEDFIVEEIFTPPHKEGEYIYVVLEKNDQETLSTIEALARQLGIRANAIGYAGIKDKRAVTHQYISIRGVAEEKLAQHGFKIVGRGAQGMSLGDHDGNKFSITVRNLDERDLQRLEKNLATVKNKKYCFVNYFGEQRFGSHNLEIGIALLQRDFKQACILLRDERIVRHLETHPRDYVGALAKIPRKKLMLFIHAVQSKLWNVMAERVAEERIPIPGYMVECTHIQMREIIEQFLADLGLTVRSFALREIPNLFTGGGERARIVCATDFKNSRVSSDDLHPGKKKMLFSFILPKAAYATVCIKSLFS